MDLGLTSQWGEFSLLLIGGLTGYFLILGFWRDRPEIQVLFPLNNQSANSGNTVLSDSTSATDGKLEDKLANYKIPEVVLFTNDALPRIASEKIDRVTVKKLLS